MNPSGAVIFRLDPLMPVHAYKTYGLSMPLRTHWRPATCEEAGCAQYRQGWVTTCDLGTELGQKQAHYIRHDRSRRAAEQSVNDRLVKFTFAPGQDCFRSGDHKVPLERPAVFSVRGGDWRGNPTGVPARLHKRAEDWVEDFALHQDRLATAAKEG
jgi:hypothetical protein